MRMSKVLRRFAALQPQRAAFVLNGPMTIVCGVGGTGCWRLLLPVRIISRQQGEECTQTIEREVSALPSSPKKKVYALPTFLVSQPTMQRFLLLASNSHAVDLLEPNFGSRAAQLLLNPAVSGRRAVRTLPTTTSHGRVDLPASLQQAHKPC